MIRHPLDDVKVVDMGSAIAGPVIGKSLADWGATVVRVESHHRPDVTRSGGPFKDGVPGVDRSALFADLNSSKLSLSVDITHADASAVLSRLFQWADAIITGFRPGVVEKLGLGYEQVRATNPSIVYLSTSLQGTTGPMARFAGFGNQAGALAGISELTGWHDRRPSQPFGAVTDFFSPRVGLFALLAALDHTRRTGHGQYIDQSQLETATLLLGWVYLDYDVNGRLATRSGNRSPDAAPHGAFPTRGNDRWCTIAVFTDTEWRALCAVAERPDWASDSRFSTLDARKRHEDALEAELVAWTRRCEAVEISARLQAVGVASAPVLDVEDLLANDQLLHRGHFRRRQHPVIGSHLYNGPAFRLSRSTDRQTHGPRLGEHNQHVLEDLLAFSRAEVAELEGSGVLTGDADAAGFHQAF